MAILPRKRSRDRECDNITNHAQLTADTLTPKRAVVRLCTHYAAVSTRVSLKHASFKHTYVYTVYIDVQSFTPIVAALFRVHMHFARCVHHAQTVTCMQAKSV